MGRVKGHQGGGGGGTGSALFWIVEDPINFFFFFFFLGGGRYWSLVCFKIKFSFQLKAWGGHHYHRFGGGALVSALFFTIQKRAITTGLEGGTGLSSFFYN